MNVTHEARNTAGTLEDFTCRARRSELSLHGVNDDIDTPLDREEKDEGGLIKYVTNSNV